LSNNSLLPIEQQLDSLLSDKSNEIKTYIVKKDIVKHTGGYHTDIQTPFKKVDGINAFSKV
jgi:hypothetical protein